MNKQVLMQAGLSGLSMIIYLMISSAAKSAIRSFGMKRDYQKKRIIYTYKFVSVLLLILLSFALIIIWGIDVRHIFIFVSSFFAVVGIALFASWSVLSNITAGVIIFFSFPYKIGDSIRLVDGENSVEGIISDMTVFHMKIKDMEGNMVLYPNNLAIQKPIIKKNLAPKKTGTPLQ